MKVLILGADGYLGWPTTIFFSNKGYDVYAVDNLSKRKIETEFGTEPLNLLKPFHERVKIWNKNQKNQINYLVADLLNYKVLSEILEKFRPDTIIHYAEQPSAPYSMASREKAVFTQHNNVIGNLNLLFAMKKFCPNSHLIKLGTMGEYGTPNIDIEEGWLELEHNGRKDKVLYPKKPGSFYHLSKVHDSANIEFACRIWGLKCTDLNQGLVYGISTDEIELDYENLSTAFHYDSIFGTIINRFITQIVCKKDMTVYGKGNQKRAFLNISDTINCVSIACQNPPKNGEFRVFNQFTEFCSLNEIANRIKNFADDNNIKSNISHIENPRIEEEDHYYNPKNTSLISLGLKPIIMDNEQINKIFKLVKQNQNRINLNTLKPNIKWKK
jgi:UDP-sulfoquinovose synthase